MVTEVNPQTLSDWLSGTSLPQRARILNRIAHDLTICTREFEAVTEPFKDPALVTKNANRPQRVATSALGADRSLHGWRRGEGLSNGCFCQDSVREGNPLPDLAVS